MNTFATLDDFKDYSGLTEIPDNASFLIKRANELVYFRIEQNFNPNKEKHVEAAKNAVCSQVMFWISANASPTDSAINTGFSLGDLSMNAGEGASSNPTKLCPLSLAYLRSEGLTYKGLGSACIGEGI